MKISILIPIYNRNNFKNLIIYNLKNLEYNKNNLELVILDDGTDLFIKNENELNYFKEQIYPIELNYINDKSGRKTIGYKRNKLVKNAKHNICSYMDSDDLYAPSYLTHSINVMNNGKFSIVGSNQMLFIYPTEDMFDNWKITGIQCGEKRMIHEATMVFNKKYFKAMGGFANSSKGEGVKMFDGMDTNKIGLTEINKIMFCICHKNNTVEKEMFKNNNTQDIKLSQIDKYKIVQALCSNIRTLPVGLEI